MTTAPPPGHREAYGPQTWALIREAYLAGTPAPHLSRTFGPHIDTIRKRAVRELWTRSAHAAAQERATLPPRYAPIAEAADPPSPTVALDRALVQAAAHIAAGREAQADAALRRGETLARLAETARRLRPVSLEQAKDAVAELRADIEVAADRAARVALNDPAHAGPLCSWAYLWRAQHLGAECAAEDERRRKERAMTRQF